MKYKMPDLAYLAKDMDLTRESEKCFYIRQNSLVPEFTEFYDVADGDEPTMKRIHLKYCLKVKLKKSGPCSHCFFLVIVVIVTTLISICMFMLHEPDLEQQPDQTQPPSLRTQTNYIKSRHSAVTLECLVRLDGKEKYDDLACAICLSDLQMCDQVKKLKCQHVFHADCVDLWGEKANTCPLCKMDFSQHRQQRSSESNTISGRRNSGEETRRSNFLMIERSGRRDARHIFGGLAPS
jgi:hypothetical protein